MPSFALFLPIVISSAMGVFDFALSGRDPDLSIFGKVSGHDVVQML